MVRNCSALVQDPFGNYAYQYVVENNLTARPHLIRALIEPLRELSCHKFSSNVVEKVAELPCGPR